MGLTNCPTFFLPEIIVFTCTTVASHFSQNSIKGTHILQLNFWLGLQTQVILSEKKLVGSWKLFKLKNLPKNHVLDKIIFLLKILSSFLPLLYAYILGGRMFTNWTMNTDKKYLSLSQFILYNNILKKVRSRIQIQRRFLLKTQIPKNLERSNRRQKTVIVKT